MVLAQDTVKNNPRPCKTYVFDKYHFVWLIPFRVDALAYEITILAGCGVENVFLALGKRIVLIKTLIDMKSNMYFGTETISFLQ